MVRVAVVASTLLTVSVTALGVTESDSGDAAPAPPPLAPLCARTLNTWAVPLARLGTV